MQNIIHQIFLIFGTLIVPLSIWGQDGEADPLPEPDPKTIIESESLELVSNPEQNFFLFEGNVRITGTNLSARCDRMEVISNRTPGSDPDATVGEVGSIEQITAIGNVVITQSGRVAEAGRAEIYPQDGKVILTEDPKVTDGRGMVATGPRMVLLEGERRVLIEGVNDEAQQDTARPTVTLPSIPDLGFDWDPQNRRAGAEENGEGEEDAGSDDGDSEPVTEAEDESGE